MRSSSWNDEASVQKAPRRGSWLKWLLIAVVVAVGIPAVVGGAFAGMAMSHRASIWPAVRLVHSRLQTDEGAKELFAKNPALAGAYADDQAFLDTVRRWRGKLGALPDREPQEGPDYELSLDPEGAGVRVKGLGGAWMKAEIHGGALSGPEDGEGLVRLFFSEDEKGLEAAESEAYEQQDAHDLAVFRDLFLQCRDDAGAVALYRREAGLRASYPSEAAFIEHVKPLRPAIAKLADVPKLKEDQFHRIRRDSPMGHVVAFSLEQGDGARLTATWRNGRISSLEMEPPPRQR